MNDYKSIYERLHRLCAKIESEPPTSAKGENARGQLCDMALDLLQDLAEDHRKRFEAGYKMYLMETLLMFFDCDSAPPPWAREALSDATRSDPKSWDDVFGKPVKRNADQAIMAVEEGMKLCAEGYKRDDNQLFPALAERINKARGTNISAGTAKNRFYSIPRALAPFYSPESKIDAESRRYVGIIIYSVEFLKK
jgi:hypothetical protein